MSEAFIYDHLRTPRGKGRPDGSLHSVSPVNMLAQVLVQLRDRNSLDTALVEDVIAGCGSPIGEQGSAIGRSACLAADYASGSPRPASARANAWLRVSFRLPILFGLLRGGKRRTARREGKGRLAPYGPTLATERVDPPNRSRSVVPGSAVDPGLPQAKSAARAWCSHPRSRPGEPSHAGVASPRTSPARIERGPRRREPRIQRRTRVHSGAPIQESPGTGGGRG